MRSPLQARASFADEMKAEYALAGHVVQTNDFKEGVRALKVPVWADIGLRVGGALFLVFTYVFLANAWIGDDAYITFSFSKSPAAGNGPIYSHDLKVEGYSNFLWMVLVAFGFGAFIEGAAGFGTPIAICAAMLIGLGFRPLPAAGLSLIGNTAPVAFGAIGTPLITLASVTGLPLEDLSAMVGRQLPFFSVILPFWLVAAMAGALVVSGGVSGAEEGPAPPRR